MPHEHKFVLENVRNLVYLDKKWISLKKMKLVIHLRSEEGMSESITRSNRFTLEDVILYEIACRQNEYNKNGCLNERIGL